MEDKEFTKDMFKLYVAQRKKLDSTVPKSFQEQYTKNREQYASYKVKQKERYQKAKTEGGEEFLQKMRDKNKEAYRRKKEREESTSPVIGVASGDSISRYSNSITKSNYAVDDDDEDLESVFSVEPTNRNTNTYIHSKFIGF